MSDAPIRESCAAGEVDRAATLLLERHGREVMLFMLNRSDHQLASDAFAQFAEDVWRGLAGFEFRCSVRSWAFRLAHHALVRVARQRARDQQRHVHAFASSSTFELAARMRSETLPYLRREVQEGIARLRERLSDDEQLLVELRVARSFSWKDIARITLGPDEEDLAIIEREAARLRKRFELIKRQLRAWAQDEGLLSDGT